METGTTTNTPAEFWPTIHYDRARWRTARRVEPQWCADCVDHTIRKGDRYFDTGEVEGQWSTIKICERHATMTWDEIRADRVVNMAAARQRSEQP